MILQFPDSPLVPQAKERLLEVQEVLAQREYLIGHFYFLREDYPAAIARLKSVADTYPLYSGADEALYRVGRRLRKRDRDHPQVEAFREPAKGCSSSNTPRERWRPTTASSLGILWSFVLRRPRSVWKQ